MTTQQQVQFFTKMGASASYSGKQKVIFVSGVRKKDAEQAMRARFGRHLVFHFPCFIKYAAK